MLSTSKRGKEGSSEERNIFQHIEIGQEGGRTIDRIFVYRENGSAVALAVPVIVVLEEAADANDCDAGEAPPDEGAHLVGVDDVDFRHPGNHLVKERSADEAGADQFTQFEGVGDVGPELGRECRERSQGRRWSILGGRSIREPRLLLHTLRRRTHVATWLVFHCGLSMRLVMRPYPSIVLAFIRLLLPSPIDTVTAGLLVVAYLPFTKGIGVVTE